MSDPVRQLTRERDRLRLLLEINNAVISHLDLGDLLRAVSGLLGQLVPHDMSVIALYDAEVNGFRAGALDFPEHQDFMKESEIVPLEGSPLGLSFTTRQPVLRRRIDLEEFPGAMMRRGVERGIKSGCSVPLVSHERALGVLSVGSRQESAFTESDLELLGQIGKQIAIAVENALNFGSAFEAQQQLKHERDRSQLLLDVTNAVISQLDLRELFKVVADYLRGVVDYIGLVMTLIDAESGVLRVHAMEPTPRPGTAPFEEGDPHPVEGTPVAAAFALRRTVLISRAELESLTGPVTQRIVADGVKSGLVAPSNRPRAIARRAAHGESRRRRVQQRRRRAVHADRRADRALGRKCPRLPRNLRVEGAASG